MNSNSKASKGTKTLAHKTHNNAGLPYMPGLDGLRALAVVAVIAYHSEIESVPGGFLGVEIFFVISGYLITALLLEEFNLNSAINLRQFWGRRARRLLPALFLYIGGSVAFAYSMAEDVVPTKGEVLSTLGYVYNWFGIFQEISYTDVFERKNFFHHLWSLAVEEQFYLLWPILLLCLQRYIHRKVTISLLILGITSSAFLMWTMYQPFEDPLRVYYGTDTRASGLLIGALLAYIWRPWNAEKSELFPKGKDALLPVGLAALGILIWANTHYTLLMPDADQLFRGGLLMTSIATAIVIACVVTPNSNLNSILGLAPFVWVGKRSYGLYLWHWPVFQLTRERVDVDINGWELFAVRMFVTLVLVEISYQCIERPIRERRMMRELAKVKKIKELKSSFPKLALSSLGVLASIMILQGVQADRTIQQLETVDVVAAETPKEVTDIDNKDNSVSTTMTPTPSLEPQITPQPQATPIKETPLLVPDDAGNGKNPNQANFQDLTFNLVDFREAVVGNPEVWQELMNITSYAVSIHFDRITFIGDSVMLGALTDVGNDGVEEAFLQDISTISDQVTVSAAKNRQWYELRGIIRDLDRQNEIGEIVVIHLGNNGVIDESIINESLELLHDARKVLLINVRVPRRWENKVNNLLSEAVVRFENTELLDWYSLSNNKPEYFSRDGVHTIPIGARNYVDAIITSLGGESVLNASKS
ncbi:MAG: acyltransferase [Acidimicrobiales bacterium]|nr:acyltransferase [Acidimicrobiales bacterium]